MPANVEEFSQRLKEERKRLSKGLEQLRASAPPVGEAKEGSPYGKKEEGASETWELERRLALERSLSELLSEVEHALEKVEQGTYGLCDVCGEPISIERLEVLPQANLCVACKTRQAKNAKVRFPPK